MTTATISDVRKNLSDTLNTVQYNHERVILQRRGKPVAVIVPIEDYATLEELEDRHDIREAEKALSTIEEEGTISLEDSMQELGFK